MSTKDRLSGLRRKRRLPGYCDLYARVRAAARQEQFLEVVSAEEARSRFEKHLELKPFAAEYVKLADSRFTVDELVGKVIGYLKKKRLLL